MAEFSALDGENPAWRVCDVSEINDSQFFMLAECRGEGIRCGPLSDAVLALCGPGFHDLGAKFRRDRVCHFAQIVAQRTQVFEETAFALGDQMFRAAVTENSPRGGRHGVGDIVLRARFSIEETWQAGGHQVIALRFPAGR